MALVVSNSAILSENISANKSWGSLFHIRFLFIARYNVGFLYCGIDGIRLLFVQYTVHWFSEIFATFTIVCTIRVFSVFTHIPYTVLVCVREQKLRYFHCKIKIPLLYILQCACSVYYIVT